MVGFNEFLLVNRHKDVLLLLFKENVRSIVSTAC